MLREENIFMENDSVRSYVVGQQAAENKLIFVGQDSDEVILNLNVSIAASLNQVSGIGLENVYEWLWKQGLKLLLDKRLYCKEVHILAQDVVNKEIITPIDNLDVREIKKDD